MDKEQQTIHYVYVLECADRSLYTGWTTHLAKRLRVHNEGKGAKYTKSRLPVYLKYYEKFVTKSEALRRECEIKKLSRREKLDLINHKARKDSISCQQKQVKFAKEQERNLAIDVKEKRF